MLKKKFTMDIIVFVVKGVCFLNVSEHNVQSSHGILNVATGDAVAGISINCHLCSVFSFLGQLMPNLTEQVSKSFYL